MAKNKRLDKVLIEKGAVFNRSDAFIRVTEGLIFVDGQKAVSPAQFVSEDVKIEVRDAFRFVGRGALKLEAALAQFKMNVSGKVCADIGAATGGFTQVLLERDAKKVYAIDTARGKLALKIRSNPRVVVMEGTDVRDLERLPELVDLITIDVSLISLRGISLHVGRFLKKSGAVVALFKPQYETRDPKTLRHGVIRDSGAREKILSEFISWAEMHGWKLQKKITSPIHGSKGNVEYLLHLRL